MDKASWLGLEVDWGGIATLVAGVLAVGAAWWTVQETKNAARAEALQKKQAVAARVIATLEVTRAHLEEWKQSGYSRLDYAIPWSAFVALSADIGLLGISGTRMFYFIEGLARELEGSAGGKSSPATNSDVSRTPSHPANQETLEALFETIRKLRRLCFRILPREELTPKEREYASQPLGAPDPE